MLRTLLVWTFLSLGALAPSPAFAAQVFADDVETGDLTTATGGKWTNADLPVAGNTLTATAAAAHRGTYGIELSDAHGGGGSGEEGELDANVSLSSTAYVRFWFRAADSNGSGTFTFLSISDTGSAATVLELVGTATGNLTLGGTDSSNVYTTASPATVDYSGWHLMEAALVGLGTGSGARTVWVDGQEQATQTGIDWSSSAVARLEIGEPWSDVQSFMGKLNFDDVRMSTEAPASTLTVIPGDGGTCAPVVIGLAASTGSAAPAPGVVPVALSVTDGGAVYADTACANAITQTTLSSDAGTVSIYVAGAASTTTLTATSTDFLSGSAPVSLTPTSGPTGPTPSSSASQRGYIGWGCTAAGGVGPLGLLLPLLVLLRRRA